jgi:hypothetical protein
MSDDKRTMVIHYVDGTEQMFMFPRQADEYSIGIRFHEFMSQNHILFEVEGKLLLIPFHQIKKIEFSPLPDKLPGNVIKGVRLIK